MQFNPKVIEAKRKCLDEIKTNLDILQKVLNRNIGADYNIIEKPRLWVGGGATSFIIEFANRKAFLKVKDKNISVESKLEEELDFITEPCLEHEKRMLEQAKENGVNVPNIIFFDIEGNFQFLATEFIENSFFEFLEKSSIEDTIHLWNNLYTNVQKLFDAGIVHSDLHEYNLRVNNSQIVLIDFEEARFFPQNCTFEKSLDYKGRNEISSLGEFPLANEQDYTIKINSLLRMREVIKRNLLPKIINFIKECNYDSTNGICSALDHGKSELTYQSIQNKYFTIKGQRDLKDYRPQIIEGILKNISADSNWTFVDVGSNNGLFCREISKKFDGNIRAIGLEGFNKFNILAKALAFVDDCRNVEYKDFLCGEDNLQTLGINNNCFISICSVWHHIQRKDVFIEQLKRISLKHILFEMPVQSECYEGRSWEEEISTIKEKLGFKGEYLLAISNDYKRPMVLISKESIPESIQDKLKKEVKKILFPSFFDKLTNFFK